MRSAFLAAAIIVVAHAASAWSQEPGSLSPSPVFLKGASSGLQPEAAEAASQPLPEDETPNYGDTPQAGYGYRVWGSAEVLLWWLQPGHTPALATSGTTASGGALGPGTTTLFGGNQDNGPMLGGRFTLGYWLDEGQTVGLMGSYFFLNNTSSDSFNVSSSGAPGSAVLARPFVNAINGAQDSQQVAFPGVTSGNMQIASSSFFQGAQLNGLCNLCCCNNVCCPTDPCDTSCCYLTGYRVDLIGGFLWMNLNENLGIGENITVLPTAPPPFVPGSTIMVADNFQTRNNFYGGQIGARAEWWRGAWFTNVQGIVALGDTHQEVTIGGSSAFAGPGGAPVTQRGGLLALPTNIGTYSRDQFSVIPQVGLNVGRQLTNHVRVFVGYTFMYWSSVVRPGDQIDPVVNPTQLPTPSGPGTLVGPARPAFAFHETSVWIQGVNVGMGITW